MLEGISPEQEIVRGSTTLDHIAEEEQPSALSTSKTKKKKIRKNADLV